MEEKDFEEYAQLENLLDLLFAGDEWSQLSLNQKCRAFKRIGTLCYNNYFDKQALVFYKDSSLNLLRKHKIEDEALELSLINNVASVYYELENENEAYRWYGILDNRLKHANLTVKNADHLLNLGGIHLDFGDQEKALLNLHKSEAVFNIYDTIVPSLYNELGSCYETLGDFSKAQEYFDLYREVVDLSDEQKSIYYYNSIRSYLKRGEDIRALESLDSLFEYVDMSNIRNDNFHHYALSSLVYKRNGHYKKSEQILQKLSKEMSMREDLRTLRKRIQVLENWGDLKLAEDKIKEAIDFYDQSLNTLWSEQSLKDLPFIYFKDYIRVLGLKSRARLALAKKTNSLDIYEDVLQEMELLDSLVKKHVSSFWRKRTPYNILKLSHDFFAVGIEAGIKAYESTGEEKYLNKAYQFMSSNKGSWLNKMLYEKELKRYEMPDALVEQEYSYLKKLAEVKDKIEQNYNSPKDTLIKYYEELFTYDKRIESIYSKIVDGRTIYEDTRTYIETVKSIRKRLKSDEAIIEYYFSDNVIYSVFIDRKSISGRKVLLTSEEIREYILYQSGRNAKVSEELLGKVFLELVGNLAIGEHINHLNIITDGLLTKVAFEGLSDNNEFLVSKYEVSYLLNNKFLKKHHKKIPRNNLLCMGTDYDQEELNLLASDPNNYFLNSSESIGPLVSAEREARDVMEVFEGKILTDTSASKQNFLKFYRDFSILQLSLHGFVNDEFPMQSGVLFDVNRKDPDYYLNAREIMQLDMDKDLVVLSSCHSGSGKYFSGEGVENLTRSLTIGGSRSNIVNIWEVSDESNSQILKSFYKNLSEGQRKSEALRNAKLKYLDEVSPTFRKPEYWASMILVGDNTPLINDSFYWLKYLLLLAAIIIIFMVVYKKSKGN